MTAMTVEIGQGLRIGDGSLVCIAGPCVVEGRDVTLRIADAVADASVSAGVPVVFKASLDKANRTSIRGFRGIGFDEALRVLQEVATRTGLPVLTDVHLPDQATTVAEVADVLQIPAFLCRQTDLIVAAAATAKPLNIKKGQFVAPHDMRHAVAKARAGGAAGVILTERGTTFGHNDLVVDFRSLPIMRALGCPVVFDATHSVQRPSAAGEASGGDRRLVPPLLRAAVAAGVEGIFLEVHENPDEALCDGPNSLPTAALPALLEQVRDIFELVAGLKDPLSAPNPAGRVQQS